MAALMLTRRRLFDAAAETGYAVRITPAPQRFGAFLRVFTADVVWAVWLDRGRIGVRLIKGWPMSGEPDAWRAVFVADANNAIEFQEHYGDGPETLDRDDYPVGLLRAPRTRRAA